MNKKSRRASGDYLDGQILVAMPSMPDERFKRSVIYMCAHSQEGAMGLMVNRRAEQINFSELLAQLAILDDGDAPTRALEAYATPVLYGGPVETRRGFVLHSDDFHLQKSTLAIRPGVSLTASLDILRAIALGQGPKKSLLTLGYSSWSPGQLENEIALNGWLTGPGDPELIFSSDQNGKYRKALESLGIDPIHLSDQAGRA